MVQEMNEVYTSLPVTTIEVRKSSFTHACTLNLYRPPPAPANLYNYLVAKQASNSRLRLPARSNSGSDGST